MGSVRGALCPPGLNGRLAVGELDRGDAGRREAENLTVEGELGLQRDHDRLGLPEAVRLALERDVAVADAMGGEIAGDALGLLWEDDRVIQPLQQQDRAGCAGYVADRGAFGVDDLEPWQRPGQPGQVARLQGLPVTWES